MPDFDHCYFSRDETVNMLLQLKIRGRRAAGLHDSVLVFTVSIDTLGSKPEKKT